MSIISALAILVALIFMGLYLAGFVMLVRIMHMILADDKRNRR